MEPLLSLVLLLIVLAVLFYIVKLAAGYFGAPEMLIQAIGLVFLLIFLIAVARAFGVVPYGWKP